MPNIIHRISLKHLVLLSFIFNLIMYCTIRSWKQDVIQNHIIISDAKGYEILAENLLKYHTFASNYDTSQIPLNSVLLSPAIYSYDTYRVPGQPFFLAFVYFISGIKPYIAIFIQIILNSFSLIWIYKITLILFDNKLAAVFAGLMFAIDIHSIYMANIFSSDILFIFLFLPSIYHFLAGYKKKNIINFIASALFMGLACLTRPVAVFYPLVLFTILIIFPGDSRRWILKVIAFYIFIVYGIISLWVLRNHTTYGKWQFTSVNGYNLMEYNVAFTESRKSLVNIQTVRANLEAQCDSLGCRKMRNPFDRSNLCGKVAWNYIMHNKWAYIETQLWGALHMFISIGNIDLAHTLGWNSNDVNGQLIMNFQRIKQNFSYKRQALLGLLIIIILVIQYFGAIYGLIEVIKHKYYFILLLSILTILYFSAITGAIGKYRYKIPMDFVIFFLSGIGYYYFLRFRLFLGPKNE